MTLQPTRTPRKTSTPGAYVFLSNLPKNPDSPVKSESKPLPIDPNLLTGLAAVSAAAGATAVALLMRRRREEELEQRRQESESEAHAIANKKNQARLQGHLDYLANKKARQKAELLKNGFTLEAIQKILSTGEISLPKSYYGFDMDKFMSKPGTKKFIRDEKRFDPTFAKDFQEAVQKRTFTSEWLNQDGAVILGFSENEARMITDLQTLEKTRNGQALAYALVENNLRIVVKDANSTPIYQFGKRNGVEVPMIAKNLEACGRVATRSENGQQVRVIELDPTRKRRCGSWIKTIAHEAQHRIDYASWFDETDKLFAEIGEIVNASPVLTTKTMRQLSTTYTAIFNNYLQSEINAHYRGYLVDENPELGEMDSVFSENQYKNAHYVIYERGYGESYIRYVQNIIRKLYPDSIFNATIHQFPSGKISISIEEPLNMIPAQGEIRCELK